LSVDDFKRMNNESYIRITLSNLAALIARAKVLVYLKTEADADTHVSARIIIPQTKSRSKHM
jgi:hypothetical protein